MRGAFLEEGRLWVEYRTITEKEEKQQMGMCLDGGMERKMLIPQRWMLLSSGSAEIFKWSEAGIKRKRHES